MTNSMWWILGIGIFIAVAVRKGGTKLSVVVASFALGIMLAGTAAAAVVYTGQRTAEQTTGGFFSYFLHGQPAPAGHR